MSVPYEDVQALFKMNGDLKKLAEDAYNAYIGLRNEFKGKVEEVESIYEKANEEHIAMLTKENQDLKRELAEANAEKSNAKKEEDEFRKQADKQWNELVATLHQKEAKRAELENALAITSTAVFDLAQAICNMLPELYLQLKSQNVGQLEKKAISSKSQLDSAKSDVHVTGCNNNRRLQASEEDLKFKLQLAHTDLYELDKEWKKENEDLKSQIVELTRKLKESEASRKRSINEAEQNAEELDHSKENEAIEEGPPSKKVKIH